MDLHDTQRTADATPWAVEGLKRARTTLEESQDFASSDRPVDPGLVPEIIRSHQNAAVLESAASAVTATQALDLYLESARKELVRIARRHVGAAQAMDLIAAIRLQRGTPNSIPEETALCLRRAALEGQPGNTSLALQLGTQLTHMGLLEEAEATLSHAMNLSPSQSVAEAFSEVKRKRGGANLAGQVAQMRLSTQQPATRVPQVTQLTPAESAAISPPINSAANPIAAAVPAQTIAARQASVPTATTPTANTPTANTAVQVAPLKQASQLEVSTTAEPEPPKKKGFWSRLFPKKPHDQP